MKSNACYAGLYKTDWGLKPSRMLDFVRSSFSNNKYRKREAAPQK